MKIALTAIVPRRNRSKSDSAETMFADYVERIGRYVSAEAHLFETEAAFLEWMGNQGGRVPAYAILLDSRGKQLSSEELAQKIGRLRDDGTQRLVLAVGPADGWSEAARSQAALLLSLGKITLPHQLARVVVAEQVYRALTILAGHPYHSGH